jgi:acetoacetyl-CoA synthetase
LSSVLARLIDERHDPGYASLHAWSVRDRPAFWRRAWHDCGVVGEPGPRTVAGSGFFDTAFFPDARLNVVDTLLAGPEDVEALVGIAEDGARRSMTRGEVKDAVAAVAAALEAIDVRALDRVAAWVPNIPEAAIFALGALSVGAVVSTASPDFGPTGVVDRFGQIEPVVLLIADHYSYGGRVIDCRRRLPEILSGLPSVRTVVIVGGDPDGGGEADGGSGDLTVGWDAWLAPHAGVALAPVPLPFDHPGFVLFSSGTTGKPKCIVHRAAGVLLKVLSEQVYHLDVRPGDRVLYFTTCGWMMWNWLLCALGTGATVVLFDGNPMYPAPDRLFAIAEDERLTFLGVSAKFLDSARKAGLRPGATFDLAALRTVASTGSPLSPEGFDFVVESVSPSAHLASISGGTDICGCFVIGVPTLPVVRGELQAAALGMAVDIFDESGQSVPVGVKGELVCTAPFPSQPLGFWGDADGSRFRAAYFERFPDAWAHGDFIARTESGGYVIYGRSDATLNANGVRIGTAEIYRVVEQFDEVIEAIAVAQEWDSDTRVVLFVVLRPGVTLDDALERRLGAAIRAQASPRHVPGCLVQVPEIPRTRSNKLAELAVTDIINARPVRDTAALANPAALAWFAEWAAS